ncbi:MAG: asparaginase domain-containing protein [Pseudomonadota bacterium]
MPHSNSQPPLRLIYAGGTIGAAGTPLVPLAAKEFCARWDLSVAPVLAARPETTGPVDWQWLEPALDSSDMGPADWLRLADEVLRAAEEGSATGVVLLHGTDTLASSAAALSFLLTEIDNAGRPVARLPATVVVTGSQRPLFDGDAVAPGTDALRNLSDAVAHAREAGPGVAVVFAGAQLPGARVTKGETEADAAFLCPNGAAQPVALPDAAPTALSTILDALAPALGRRPVPVLHPMPEAPEHQAAVFEALADGGGAGVAGLIVAGFGEGNLPARAATRIAAAIARLREAGAPVVAASQVAAGPAGRAAYATGHWLREAGAVPAGLMTLEAAHAKLHIGAALSRLHDWPLATLEAFLMRDIAGETLPADPD